MQPVPLTPAEFLSIVHERLVLDVRSPGEYAQGHIPGAVSFPLFTDEERAKVGTAYKQQGRDVAFTLGLRFVGPKMEGFVKTARRLADGRDIAVHCWRGGQRSGSMAWLLRSAGMNVVTLAGGYKAYRQDVLSGFERIRINAIIVGGKTGSGKTKVIRALRDLGEQIIDLEAIAHHKGSAFGTIGEAPQPTVEQFENNLYAALCGINQEQRIWLENESRSIGRVFIPDAFWRQMKASPLVNIQIPDAARLQNLLDDYVGTDKQELIAAFMKIDKKLGGQHLKAALEALEQDDYATAAEIALKYYDKTYQHCLDVNVSPDIRNIAFEHGHPQDIARAMTSLDIPQLI